MTAAAPPPPAQRGFALVAALWAAMMLALIAASIMTTTRTEARIGRSRASAAQGAAIADAGINATIYRLLAHDPADHPPLDGTPFGLAFEGRIIELRVQDEAGKVDLNFAPAAVLSELLAAAGLDPDAARLETDRIIDWREHGELRRLNGAKREDYRRNGYAYAPRDAAFLSTDELRLVMGITPDLYARLQPAITVLSQSRDVDPAVAPAAVLLAFGGPNAGTEGARPAAHADLTGHAFTIEAVVVEQGRSAPRRAAIRLSGDPAHPVWVYGWN